MMSMKCYALCGFTQLCIIACPNNRNLGELAVLLCSSDLEPEDDSLPLKIEFADPAELQRDDKGRPACE